MSVPLAFAALSRPLQILRVTRSLAIEIISPLEPPVRFAALGVKLRYSFDIVHGWIARRAIGGWLDRGRHAPGGWGRP